MSSEKSIVEIFGIKGKVAFDPGCDCGEDSCGDPPTMDEQAEGLNRHLKSRGYSNVEVEFIDVNEEDEEQIELIKSLIDENYPLPFTAVNGILRYYGAIVPERILEEIETQRKQQQE